MTEPDSDGPELPQEPETEGKYLRLHCPFCRAETALWFRPEGDLDDTMSPAEWERWLGTPCRDCGRTPREHPGRKISQE